MSIQVDRRHFTVDEFYRMAEIGIFTEDDRVELIEGDIIELDPVTPLHASCVMRFNHFLGRKTNNEYIMSVHNPVRLNEYSETLPDISLLKRRDDFYAGGHPTPPDVLLIIEVADTSLDYDRNIKVPLYARAGIPEVWVVDLASEAVEVFVEPQKGAYQTIRTAKRGESITAQEIASLTISIDTILG